MNNVSKNNLTKKFFDETLNFIRITQLPNGSIPWFKGGYCDPWDHVEAAMGLSIGGDFVNAERAYQWLVDIQLEDGSWWAAYKGDKVESNDRKETNFVAYIATGVWHHYLISQNKDFLSKMWPCVKKAIDFVLSQQQSEGDINWAVGSDGFGKKDALITGCCSIYKSLECAYNISVLMNSSQKDWLSARDKLGYALREKPYRFDRTWKSKERFSMDWFYPVLSGVLSSDIAKNHLKSKWNTFVEEGLGCRCVSDEPWVTIAESCELTIALIAAGDFSKASELFSWLHRWRLKDGSYWTGYQFSQDKIWPDEKPTWTAGAVLLAADALSNYTRGSNLFTQTIILKK